MSDLQQLIDLRLGDRGPWHAIVARMRDAGAGFEAIARQLGADAGLPSTRLSGMTVRRWWDAHQRAQPAPPVEVPAVPAGADATARIRTAVARVKAVA